MQSINPQYQVASVQCMPVPPLSSATGSPQCRRAALAAAMFGAALSGHAWADEYLQQIGGAGGGQFQARCRDGELLAGFELRAGDDVDAIRPLCVTAYGPRDTSAASDSAWNGGQGGGPAHVVCPRHTPIVTGLFVFAEGMDTIVVNNIHLFCSLAVDPKAGDSPAAIFDAPGYRNESWFRYSGISSDTQRCPPGQAAVGVHGRSGIWLDAIGLICATPRLTVKSIGRIGTGTPAPPRPPGWTICDAARDARSRNSPAATTLETQCAASKTHVQSLGRVGTGTPPPRPPGWTICDGARSARARNSPAAPNLEAQCLASGGRL